MCFNIDGSCWLPLIELLARYVIEILEVLFFSLSLLGAP